MIIYFNKHWGVNFLNYLSFYNNYLWKLYKKDVETFDTNAINEYI